MMSKQKGSLDLSLLEKNRPPNKTHPAVDLVGSTRALVDQVRPKCGGRTTLRGPWGYNFNCGYWRHRMVAGPESPVWGA